MKMRGLVLVLAGASVAANAQMINDYESASLPVNNGTYMFRAPRFSGSTTGSLALTPDLSTVIQGAGSNATKVGHVQFQYIDSALNRWLRLTTFNATVLPNPVVDFTQILSFDIMTDQDLLLAIGLRETNSAGPIGSNGGSSGSIEWVSNVAMPSGTPPGGQLITAGGWQTISFNLASPAFVKGFTGNGVLQSTTGFGVLEHLAFTSTGSNAVTNIHLDNFRQTPVPEPASMAALGLGAAALLRRRRRA